MADIYIENFDEIKRAWKLAPKKMEQELTVALQNSLLRIEARAVKLAPKDTGHLAGKITTSLYDLTGRVHTSDGGQQVKYLAWVHEGRGAIQAKPGKVLAAKFSDMSAGQKSKFSGRVNKKGYVIFGKRVKAMKANPFFNKAADFEERAVNSEFDKAVDRVLEYLSKKSKK